MAKTTIYRFSYVLNVDMQFHRFMVAYTLGTRFRPGVFKKKILEEAQNNYKGHTVSMVILAWHAITPYEYAQDCGVTLESEQEYIAYLESQGFENAEARRCIMGTKQEDLR